MKKIRLDIYLAQNNLSTSREKAKAEIISGWVTVNDETIREPKKQITGTEKIIVKRPGGSYVSRGGEKLAHAITQFNLTVKDQICADLGASTGGFTDCLLKNGAKKVYAVDVGYGQLDYKLRNDLRVIVYERTHVNNLTEDAFNEPVKIITVDVSFISILKIIESMRKLFQDAMAVILIKPQFEAERSEHKKGVVRKQENHNIILSRVLHGLIENDIQLHDICHSPIKGPAGNIEFLLLCSFNGEGTISKDELDATINTAVELAYKTLN